MKADESASCVEFFRQSCTAILEVRTGRYWATTRKRLTVALPDCILLWAQWKMQLFLFDTHREVSFPVVSGTYEDGAPTAHAQGCSVKWEKYIDCPHVGASFFVRCKSRFSVQFMQGHQNMGLGSPSPI